MTSGIKLTPKIFKQRASLVHKNYYDYSKTIYTRIANKVIIICPKHGEFSQEAKAHLRGHGCSKCAMTRRSEPKLNERKSRSTLLSNYGLIPVSKGGFTKVSVGDFEFLSKYIWSNRSGYAYNTQLGLLHRWLLGVAEGLEVDHINRDRLDNRRSNLRAANRPQNQWNRSNPEVKFRGVSYRKKSKVWRARITHLGKTIYVGNYKCPKEAAKAYNNKAVELFGEFANLNKII